jgi:hypothetical protein
MRVFLDGREITPVGRSVTEAIAAAARDAACAGRTIVDVQADGRPLSEIPSGDSDPAPFTELRMLSAVSTPRSRLLDAARVLESIGVAQVEAAAMVRRGNPDGAMPLLADALGSWDRVLRVVRAQVPADRTAPGDCEPLSARVDKLVGGLRRVKESLARQDWAALSDDLAYDLAAEAASWRTMVERLAADTDDGENEEPSCP